MDIRRVRCPPTERAAVNEAGRRADGCKPVMEWAPFVLRFEVDDPPLRVAARL